MFVYVVGNSDKPTLLQCRTCIADNFHGDHCTGQEVQNCQKCPDTFENESTQPKQLLDGLNNLEQCATTIDAIDVNHYQSRDIDKNGSGITQTYCNASVISNSCITKTSCDDSVSSEMCTTKTFGGTSGEICTTKSVDDVSVCQISTTQTFCDSSICSNDSGISTTQTLCSNSISCNKSINGTTSVTHSDCGVHIMVTGPEDHGVLSTSSNPSPSRVSDDR